MKTKKLVECGFCGGTGDEFGAPCLECTGTGKMEPCIWFIAGKMREGHSGPNGEPFMVLRADLRQNTPEGLSCTVASFHWSESVAEQIAAGLNEAFHREVGNA